MPRFARLFVLVAGIALIGTGCGTTLQKPKPIENAPLIQKMIARINPTQGNTCEGTVLFETAKDGGVKVTIDLKGLPPNSTHGIHIHEVGDCSAPDGMSAGGHYNPEHKDHGLPPAETRHAGDLGNVTTDKDGKVHQELIATNFSLTGSVNPIVGRSVIVHAKPDDGSQPVGNAGPRLGCGVIEMPELK